jgi:nucleoside-diphosphate-sugar epimerase
MIPQVGLPARVHVIGASGRSGTALCRALLASGVAASPVVRSAERWAETGLPGAPLLADLADAGALCAALAGATHVVSCAHARHAPAVLAAAPEGAVFVFLGSTRKFTAWPDDHGNGVLAGEAAFLASGRPGVMLHPTMIYGAQGENNVRRLAAWLRRLPVVPLPGGGRALVQPIHQGDVTACVLAALQRAWPGPRSMVIVGPAPVTYADFVRAVARAAGLPPPQIVGVPLWVLMAGALAARWLPFLPRIERAELRRLVENKAFDVAEMREVLGVGAIGLDEGLRGMTFGA